jgi:cytochrome c oxidase subunit 2
VLVPEESLKPGQIRLLAVDNPVVLPIDTNIRVLTTGADVIHSWALPQLIYKIDAVPGRTNESWMRITREGTFYGQCSELCGVNHGFMPIVVQAVSKEAYQQWLAKAKTTFAALDDKQPTAAVDNKKPTEKTADAAAPKTAPVALVAGN